jgi:hypothetical protein
MQWQYMTLSGISETVSNDPYTLYIFEPENFSFEKFVSDNSEILSDEKSGQVRKITLLSTKGGIVNWKIKYH